MAARPQRADAWFVRTRRGISYNIMPCTRQGWAVTAAYCLFVLLIAPVIDQSGPCRGLADPPSRRHLVVRLCRLAHLVARDRR